MDPRLPPYHLYRDALSRLHHTLAGLRALQPALRAVIADLQIPLQEGGNVPAAWRGAVLDMAIRRGLLKTQRQRLRTAPDHIDALVLAASQQARFRLMNVRTVIPEVGVTVVDGLRGHSLDLIDAGLARSARPGVTLAGWVLVLPELTMSTGGLVVVSPAGLDAVAASLKAGRLPSDPSKVRSQTTSAEMRMATEILRSLSTNSRM